MQGWMGKTLEVDLSSGESPSSSSIRDLARLFLGGRGLGARLLWDMVGPEVEPLSPDNVLIFCTGPLTARPFRPAAASPSATKSPLTGTVLDANSGGSWGMRFKRSGYDALIIKGRADRPVYLEITPGGSVAEGRLAPLGQDGRETTRALGQRDGAQRPLHRPGGREPGALRRHHERRRARPGPRRRRRGHGVEEPEGDGRRRARRRWASQTASASGSSDTRPASSSRPILSPRRPCPSSARRASSTW